MAKLLAAGVTDPTDWRDHPTLTKTQIFVDVRTGLEAEKCEPIYICSLLGDTDHWSTTGGSSIYHPDRSGFRINLRFALDNPPELTADFARTRNWRISWAAFFDED